MGSEKTRTHWSGYSFGNYLMVVSSGSHIRTNRRRAVFWLLYASLVTLLPVMLLPAKLGSEAAFRLLTGDAYLYLRIAESSETFFSFDGERPTNGFHPLWQWYLWALHDGLGLSGLALANASAWSAVFATWVGALVLVLAIRTATGIWWLGLLAAPGAYYLLVGVGFGNLAVWDMFNGMEIGLVFALSAILCLLLARLPATGPTLRQLFVIGCVLAVIFLARLDEAFVVIGVAVALLLWSDRSIPRRFLDAVVVSAPAAVALVCYLAYNLSYMGIALPISGAAKGEGALLSNGWTTAVGIFLPLFDLRQALTGYQGDLTALVNTQFRIVQLIFPVLLAIGLLYTLRRGFRDAPYASLLSGVLIGICLKAIYNFVAVSYWHQASWYFGLAMAAISFGLAVVLAPAARWTQARAPFGAALLGGSIALLSFLHATQIAERKLAVQSDGGAAAFWEQRKAITAALQAEVPSAKLMEFGDGFLGFALDIPVRHGFVYAGDTESLEALRQGRLLRESYADGYTILSSYEYLKWPLAPGAQPSSDEIRKFLSRNLVVERALGELQYFDYDLVYYYAPRRIPFIRLTMKADAN